MKILLVICCFFAGAQAWMSLRRTYGQQSLGTGHLGDVGDPLFLTPLIEAGHLDEAKALSRVG
ncbi:unnamed protein product, partial [Ixodes pacificus]